MQTEVASEVFRALSDPTRRALFERLASGGEQPVSALTAGGNVSQPAISQHLAVLRLAGLVSERREGRFVHYRAEPQGLKPMIDWLGFYGAFWAGKFDALEDTLKRMDN